jgi:hypothetical protein
VAVVDRHDIAKNIITALRATVAVTTVFGAGAAMRIYRRVRRDVTTFPMANITMLPMTPLVSTRPSTAREWTRRAGVQFNIWQRSLSADGVAAGQKAIMDLLDTAPDNISLTTGTIIDSIPGTDFIQYDEDSGSHLAVCEHTLWVDFN